MGHGFYSTDDRKIRATSLGYDTKSRQEIFTQRSVNNAMDPNGVKIRESRDSEDHPNSVPVIINLDVTGSMGSVPHHLVREGIVHIMDNIIQCGIADPQVLFTAIGDHLYDRSPLQIGQFESSDELLDHWLTTVWLEGNGGGNMGESYLLAWYFAAFHTATDNWDKRNQKGYLFTIGDEPCLPSIDPNSLNKVMGSGQYQEYSAVELLNKVRERWDVHHLHIREGSHGYADRVIDDWNQLLGVTNLHVINERDVSKTISRIVTKNNNPQAESISPDTGINEVSVNEVSAEEML